MAAIPPAESKIFFFERAVRVHQKQRHLLFFFLPNKYHVDMIGLDLTQLSALTKKKSAANLPVLSASCNAIAWACAKREPREKKKRGQIALRVYLALPYLLV